ncbi:hypothetical protein A2415_01925 [candidate division WWE3 bacterium RIFOXYC1_FULL_39_7]|uniref:Carbohydrate binding module xylan-binding domain-containing protein n=1 Tax=candidate division WWE3 bacterium RIFOXYC1_FULL_39_7 TaxID=1802643 RepID=A0A1F4WH26_UNCKA|nr:MAG: hypothetical protein A2415_01925 [candidate division WWE3 bacterium RIFOXYC1_FULL_39_7]
MNKYSYKTKLASLFIISISIGLLSVWISVNQVPKIISDVEACPLGCDCNPPYTYEYTSYCALNANGCPSSSCNAPLPGDCYPGYDAQWVCRGDSYSEIQCCDAVDDGYDYGCVWSGITCPACCESCCGTGGTCLLPDTEITMGDGSKRYIQFVKPGDLVKSLDKNGNYVNKEVIEIETPVRDGYYVVLLEDGTELKLTDEHPAYFKNEDYEGWASIDPLESMIQDNLEIGKMVEGGYLKKEDESWLKIIKIEFFDDLVKTYNLADVADTNVFFAEGILVHNKNGCDPAPVDAPVLSSPTNNAYVPGTSVTLTWTHSGNWGIGCPDQTDYFQVFVDGVNVSGSLGKLVRSYTYNGSGTGSHTWFVRATNSDDISDSATWTFNYGAVTRIVGRVWEDKDGDNAFDFGTTEVWSDDVAPGNTCAAGVSSAIDIFAGGSSMVAGWECGTPTIPVAWYHTWYHLLPSGPGTTYTLTPHTLSTPDSAVYPCAYASWSYWRCTDSSCSTQTRSSGNTCTTGNIVIGDAFGPDWTNHIDFRLVRNQAPTATIQSANSPGHDYIVNSQLVNVIPAGASRNFLVTGTDTRPNIRTIEGWKRPFDPVSRTLSGTWQQIGSNTGCSGISCITAFPDVISPGYRVYVPNAYDEYNYVTAGDTNRCSGNPLVNNGGVVGWSDCDPVHTDGYQDESVIYGDQLPVCAGNINWTANFAAGNTIYPFSSNAPDNDGHTVNYDFDASCGDFPFGPSFTVAVYAGGYRGGGVWPLLRVYATDINGTRYIAGTQSISSSSSNWYLYTFTMPSGARLAMIETEFINDYYVSPSDDRNIDIFEVDILDIPPPTAPTTIYQFYPWQSGNAATTVYYDWNLASDVGHSSFDGLASTSADTPAYSLLNLPSPNNEFLVDRVKMTRDGALRFPMLWRSPSTPGSSCNITLTPRVALPYWDGASCTQSVASSSTQVSGEIYEAQFGDPTCSSVVSINNTLSPTAQLFNGASPILPVSTITGSSYNISPLFTSTVFDSLCINGLIGDGTRSYVLQCVNSTNVTCSVGSGSCAVNCTPTNALSSSPVAIDLVFVGYDNEKWFTALDGDMYSSSVVADVTDTPGDNFTSNVINAETASSTGGYGFAGSTIDPQRTGSGISEVGGSGLQLSVTGTHDFEDSWFNSFVFSPPAHADVGVPAGDVFQVGHIYNITVSAFNDLLTRGDYLTAGAGSGVAVLYVSGTGTIDINNDFLCGNCGSGNRKILVVTEAVVNISDAVEIPNLASFSVSEAPQIDFGIISTSSIDFLTRYDFATQTFDLPVVINGQLISRMDVNFDRNLGHLNNYNFPAELVRYSGDILHWLTTYENTNTVNINYTGLATYDVQWVYSE